MSESAQPRPPLSRCQVKVCGVREASDAAALDALGVDWIGFNFHPASSRFIEPAAAAPLVKDLRHAAPVGVFVDAVASAIVAEMYATSTPTVVSGFRLSRTPASPDNTSPRGSG